MIVLGLNAETQKAESRCQKFSLGVYSLTNPETLSPSMSHYDSVRPTGIL